MISVSVYKQGSYGISSAKVKKHLIKVLEREGIASDFTVSLAFVSDQRMKELVDKYYKSDPQNLFIHPILTFPSSEVRGEFVLPEGQKPDLGEIIISYSEVVNTSKETGKLIDDVALSLVEHGAMHLLGIHHD